MPVVNDFPGAYERIKAQADALAARLGIQKEVIYGFFNSTAHFPMTTAELVAWGNQVDPKYGVSRRDPATGAWRPIMPGVNPDPRLTAQDRGGFPHMITNAEDADIQRFQQVDATGNVFGGSWDPAFNAAHPGGGPGITTGGSTTRSAQGMEANPYPPGTPDWVAYETANPSNQPRNDVPPPDQPTAPRPAAGTGAPAAGGATVGANPSDLTAAQSLADQAAYRAYLNARLALDRDIETHRDENEKQRIALEAARDAWTKTYQTATLSGYMPNAVAGKGQAGMDAIQALRGNAQYQAADGATRQQMEAATLAQTYGIDVGAAAQAIAEMRRLTATTGQPSSAALLEQIVGKYAPGAATLDREKEQNQTTIQALTLLSQLRGPENAFAYADTLANLPPSIRANIQAAMGRLPFTPQNPAQRGVLGDVGVGAYTAGAVGPASYPGYASAIGATPGAVPQSGLPAATGPRTAQASWQQYLPVPQAAGVQPAYRGYTGQGAGGMEMMRTPTGQVSGPYQTLLENAPRVDQFQGTPLTTGAYRPDIAFGPRTQPTTVAPGEPFNPGQLSPTDMLHVDPYAAKLMWSGFEHGGGDIESGKWRFEQSLPRAVGPRVGTYRAA